MLAPQKVRDAVERIVVDEDRAQQRLLSLEIVGRRAIGRFLRMRRRLALRQMFDCRHGDGRASRFLRVLGERTFKRFGDAPPYSRGRQRQGSLSGRRPTRPDPPRLGVIMRSNRVGPNARWKALTGCPRYPRSTTVTRPVLTPSLLRAEASFRLGVFALKPRDEFGNRLHRP